MNNAGACEVIDNTFYNNELANELEEQPKMHELDADEDHVVVRSIN